MKYFNFLYLFIFNETFRTRLKWMLQYAYRTSEVVRGKGSADILLFDRYLDQIFDKDELEIMNRDRQTFAIPKQAFLNGLTIEEIKTMLNSTNSED